MKAYIIKTDKKIEPFGDHPRGCLIANKKLIDLQIKTLVEQKIKPVFVSSVDGVKSKEEFISFYDDLYFTPELLSKFIARSREQDSDTICALKKGITTLRTGASLQNVRDCGEYFEYNLKYFPRTESKEIFKPIVIDPDEFEANVPIPFHMFKDAKGYAVPMTNKFMVQIDHWVNLWSCNIVFLLAEFARVQKVSKTKLLFLVLKACSKNKWRILSKLNRIGKNCDIHPTAYVEASAIGSNVTIGAGAVIRGSAIDSEVHIGNNVVVEYSVIGENSSILSGHILYSVFYPGTFSVAEMVSASLIGRDSFLGANCTLTDFRFDNQNVLAENNENKVDSGNRFLGACLGHDVYIGSGCIIAPGRIIPNGLRMAFDKESMYNGNGSVPKGFRIMDNKN